MSTVGEKQIPRAKPERDVAKRLGLTPLSPFLFSVKATGGYPEAYFSKQKIPIEDQMPSMG